MTTASGRIAALMRDNHTMTGRAGSWLRRVLRAPFTRRTWAELVYAIASFPLKARHRVAVLHREVRETRLDHAHKVALRLVRDNQAVYAEDLCVSGLARTKLAKSVHDAGWAQLLRLIEEKAARYGRR